MAATLAIILLPILYTVSLSFTNYIVWKPNETAFVFLQNYRAVWGDEIFLQSLRHTVVWIVGVIALQLLLGFTAALFLNRDFPGRGIVRSLILIPWVTPSVITGLMWRWMYDGNSGLINDLLVRAGIIERYVPWLAQSTTSLPASQRRTHSARPSMGGSGMNA